MAAPWMHDSEIQLVLKYLHHTDIVLEWGSGGSTTYFPRFAKKYYSIEHDGDWYNKLKSQIPPNVEFHHIPWDSPRTIPTQKNQFKTYIEYVDKLNIEKFDKVFIDGRARGWCAEYVLKYLHPNSVIFIHDFWARPQYHIVFNWYDEIDSIKTPGLQTIVALKPKPEYVGINRIKTPLEND